MIDRVTYLRNFNKESYQRVQDEKIKKTVEEMKERMEMLLKKSVKAMRDSIEMSREAKELFEKCKKKPVSEIIVINRAREKVMYEKAREAKMIRLKEIMKAKGRFDKSLQRRE